MAAVTLAERPIDKDFIELMLAHMLRVPEIFLAAKQHVQPGHFDSVREFSPQVIWATALQHYELYGEYPTESILAGMSVNQARTDQFAPEPQLSDVAELVHWIWGPRFAAPGELSVPFAYDLLKRFLTERSVELNLREAVIKAVGQPIRKLPELLALVSTEMASIESLQGGGLVPLVPDEYDRPLLEVLSTGNPAFDMHMDGGCQRKETNVLLAPSGVGKTMTGVDIACFRGEAQFRNEIAQPGSGQLVVYITYEEDHELIRPRFWARGAQISKTRAERVRNYRDLSTTGNLLEYEQQRFRDNVSRGEPVAGERERLEHAKLWLNKHVHVGDFSGAKLQGQKTRGHGGPEEISQYLDMLTNQSGMGIDTVIVDWAGMAVRRFLRTKGQDDSSQISANLTDYVDRVTSLVSARFNCSTWVLHQIKGDLNNKPPGFKFHHSHAEWCTSFAVNAWFAFTISTKSTGQNVVVRCTKARRGEPRETDTVCHIDGAFGRLLPVADLMVDPITNGIVQRSLQQRFVETTDSGPRTGDLEL